MNKLAGVTEMANSLNKLDNSDNLKDGKPSNVLLRHHMTSSEEFTNFEPVLPQYKNFKDIMGEKRIHLFYPIQGKEVAVISMFSDNVQYWIKES